MDSGWIGLRKVEQTLWQQLLKGKKRRDLIETFNKIYPMKISDLDHTEEGFYITPEGVSHGLLLDNLGSGMRIGMRLLFLLFNLKNTAILMEEFDAYEFPDSLRNIARIIMEVSLQNKIQFFMTTHRMESIRAFVENSGEFPGIEGAVLCTMLKQDGILKVKNLDFNYAKKLLESGMDIRELEDYD